MAASGTISPTLLSESDEGKMILVAAGTSPGTLLHTTTAVADEVDVVSLFAVNMDTSSIYLTVQWGGTTANDQIILQIAPKAAPVQVVFRWRLTGGKEIRAFASTANKVLVYGHVQTMTL